MRICTPSFIAEFPLRTTAADELSLEKRLRAHCQIYNACLGEALRRLSLMRDSRDWQRARAMPRLLRGDTSKKPVANRVRSDLFRATQARFEFTSASIQKYAERCRDACWIGDHAGSHDTQTTSLRAFRAVEMHAFGVRGRPRFKGANRFHSVEGKGDAVIRYRTEPAPAVLWSGLCVPLMLDPRDSRQWQAQALQARTKYVRVLRRVIAGRTRWFAQLVQEGEAPRHHAVNDGVVGLDIGPSTIASVSATEADLRRFCDEVEQPWAQSRRLLRSMDRSRRATNPENYQPNGTIKRGRKSWVRSIRYRARQRKLAETERRLAATRKREHGRLCNSLLQQGTTIKTERLSYKAFQKTFGRSVKVRAPGMFVSMLRRKAAGAGGGVMEIETRTTKLSQFDHTTGNYVKKPLRQRIHVFGDGKTAPVQRDLYSAYLATCCDRNTLDISHAVRAWPAAEPLLRQAMSRSLQPTSRKGFARPHARKRVGVRRLSKGDGHSVEVGEVVAQARAPKGPDSGTLRTLRL